MRSGSQTWQAQLVEEFVWQGEVKMHLGVVPPPSRVDRDACGCLDPQATGAQLTEYGLAALPLLELIRPKTMTNPFV